MSYRNKEKERELMSFARSKENKKMNEEFKQLLEKTRKANEKKEKLKKYNSTIPLL
jgi:hypothetical protein